MRTSFFASVVALAASVSAITITFPAVSDDSKPTSVDLSKSNKITWTKVSTDPSSFKLTIKSVNTYPVQEVTIDSDVDSSDLEYDLAPVTGSEVAVGTTYQVTFYSTTADNNAIIAQSGQFTVAKVETKSASAAASSSSSVSSASKASSSAASVSSHVSSVLSSASVAISSAFASASAKVNSTVAMTSGYKNSSSATTTLATTTATTGLTGASATSASATSSSSAAAASAIKAFGGVGVMVGFAAIML